MKELADAMAHARQEIDAQIEEWLTRMEAVMRRDLAMTGPEDDDVLDRPRDPDASWHPCCVEEVLVRQRAIFEQWRDDTLKTMHDVFVAAS